MLEVVVFAVQFHINNVKFCAWSAFHGHHALLLHVNVLHQVLEQNWTKKDSKSDHLGGKVKPR